MTARTTIVPNALAVVRIGPNQLMFGAPPISGRSSSCRAALTVDAACSSTWFAELVSNGHLGVYGEMGGRFLKTSSSRVPRCGTLYECE